MLSIITILTIMNENTILKVKRMMYERNYTNIKKSIYITINNVVLCEINALTDCRKLVKCIVFPIVDNVSSVKKKDVCEIVKMYSNCDHIIVIANSVSFQSKTIIKQAFEYSEIISHTNIMLHILYHMYVPKYKVLTEKELCVITKKFGNPENFNKILAGHDPIAIYLDFRPGQVVSVTQSCCISGSNVYYRYVLPFHMI